MSWIIVKRRRQTPKVVQPNRRGPRQGLFIRASPNQVILSAELAQHLGKYVRVYRDGYKFKLVAGDGSDPTIDRPISNYGTHAQHRFSCPQLREALDPGRVPVKPSDGGFEV